MKKIILNVTRRDLFQLRLMSSLRIIFFIQLLFVSAIGIAQPTACCTNVNMNNPSFESSLTTNLRFPDITSPLNSEYDTPDSWQYADATNSWQATHIDDAGRASEGSKFVYIPFDETSPPFENYCIGNFVFNDTDNTCTDDYVFDGYRYIIYYDFMAFNQNVPAGGVGTTRPKMEYDFPATLNMYEIDGTLASEEDYTAVAWSDVSTNWTTIAGVTPALNRGGNGFMYFSHYRFGSAGMLIDNAGYTMLTVDDSEANNEAINELGNQITFELNPNSNIPAGIPGVNYLVTAPTGYTVSPTTAEYNSTTSFTLTKSAGTITPGATILLDIVDEVNDICAATITVVHPIALPITLIDFETSSSQCQTTVQWTVEDVVNFSHFQLEFSSNGLEFRTMKIVDATDEKVTNGFSEKFKSLIGHKYFRLKMIDLDGSFSYSKIIATKNSCKEQVPISIFPNPVGPGVQQTVQFESVKGTANISIVDITGQPVFVEEIRTRDGVNEYSPNTQELPAGNYFLSVQSYGMTQTVRLLIME